MGPSKIAARHPVECGWHARPEASYEISATAPNRMGTPAKVNGSNGDTLNSRLDIRRMAPMDTATPATAPMDVRTRPGREARRWAAGGGRCCVLRFGVLRIKRDGGFEVALGICGLPSFELEKAQLVVNRSKLRV